MDVGFQSDYMGTNFCLQEKTFTPRRDKRKTVCDMRDKETKKLCHTHLPAAPYSSQGGELKTGDKFPSVAGAFRTPRGGVSRSDGVVLTVCNALDSRLRGNDGG